MVKTSAVYAQSSQRVVFFLQKRIDLSVCGTPWYVPRNAQSSPGGRRRSIEGQMEGCAGVHKRQNCPLGTRPLCLSSSARSRGKRRLSARQSKSHSTCTPLLSPGLIITHISERSWHGNNISPSSSYIWQQPLRLKRTSESLG